MVKTSGTTAGGATATLTETDASKDTGAKAPKGEKTMNLEDYARHRGTSGNPLPKWHRQALVDLGVQYSMKTRKEWDALMPARRS